MSEFKVNKLFVFDKAKEKEKPTRYDNVSLLYTQIGTGTVKYEITIINNKNVVVSDLPNNFKLVAFDDGRMIYIPNVVLEEGKFICKNGTVTINGNQVETPLIIRNHFEFLKNNGIEMCQNDLEAEWPTNKDFEKSAHFCDVRRVADACAEKELLHIAEMELSPMHKAVWLSEVLTNFFMKGYKYAKEIDDYDF